MTLKLILWKQDIRIGGGEIRLKFVSSFDRGEALKLAVLLPSFNTNFIMEQRG